MKILFRCDSSSTIGLGHVKRDLVLAKQYPKDEIFFACQRLNGNINDQIPYPLYVLSSNKPEEFIKLILSLHVDFLIIDHYGINYKTEKIIKEKTGVKILCFDDTYEKHFCDILLNHNISADKNRYKTLVPPHCELRCGSKYTLIREEFKKEKERQRDKIYDVLIAMGGADTQNLTIPILKSLPKSLHVSILTTSANANLQELQEYTKDKENITLHVNSNEVAKLINQSKFAIITPSVMIHEVLFMHIPFIAIKTASNQDDIYKYLKQNNYSVMQIWNEKEFNKWFKKLIL
jgi:UDP-2,4-diacetamido-2,4,6-trideoxy-beta-L-altropyranose hydrolase